jgi:hypothetical protein
MTTRKDFERANGYSNEYWGWGSEDDDLFIRFLLADVRIDRKPGFYISLPHQSAQRSVENADRLIHSLEFAAGRISDSTTLDWFERMRRHLESLGAGLSPRDRYNGEVKDYRFDGLSTLRYDLLSRRPLKDVVQFNSKISDAHEVISVKL